MLNCTDNIVVQYYLQSYQRAWLVVVLENRATTTFNKNPDLAHHLIANLILITALIWITHWMILKHPQNGSSKGIFYFPVGTVRRGNL